MKFATTCILFALLSTGILPGLSRHACADEPKKTPVRVNADKLDYDRVNDVYTAVGNVRVEQEGMLLEADHVVLNNKTGEAVAEGRVFFNQKGDAISAEQLTINVNTGEAKITKGDLFLEKDNYHLTGERIDRKSETVYRIENGTFSTCDKGEWYLKADQIDVDLERYATANGASFNMAGLPVLYTPYILFPVRRQTGLLMPEMGYSSNEGFLMKNTLFWAISDYQDMTFTSDYRANHGLGTGIEYRYVNSRDSQGQIYYNYFDTFHASTTLWEFKLQHEEEIAEDLSMRADIRLVSDEFYYRDLEKKLELRSLPYIDSNAFYVERWDTASLYLLGQYSINLTQNNNATPQKLPELRYTIFQEKIAGPLHLNLDGSAVNFTVSEGDGVRRVDIAPQLTAAFGGGGLGFTPRAGVRSTYYSKGTGTYGDEPVSRTYFFAGADLNARISRVYGQDGEAGVGRIRHSIEPTLSYSYIPQVEQTDPVTGLPKIRQFDAVDTVTKQNTVTAVLVNRLTAHYKDASGFTTYDMMVLRVAQSYELDSAATFSSSHSRSDIIGELFWRTPKLLNVSANGKYNTYTNSLTSSNVSVGVTSEKVTVDLTHQYLKATPAGVVPGNLRTEFLIGGVGFTVDQWHFNTKFWRDREHKQTTQQELTAHYASQCWGFGASYIKRPGETQYLMTLELKGLGAMKLL
jgi:LPS-assembly protein